MKRSATISCGVGDVRALSVWQASDLDTASGPRTALPMPTVNLDTGDAVELAELLQFLHDWLAADPDRLSTGSPSCSVAAMATACSGTNPHSGWAFMGVLR